uniref:Uncharacterized protein n=1 Tax=Panagrolaimus davidi TaxID=227884 RepID=A0A914PWD6_9BILA
MDVFERFKEQLIKLIDAHPIDIINKVRPLTAHFFPKANTSPSSLRQRALIMILKVYELNKESPYRSFVNTILEEILFCVSSFLESQNEEYLKTLSTVEFTCPQMVEDSVPIVLKLQPKKSILAIKALYKLSDENCDMALIFKRELWKMMLDLPELTVEWIHCLKFNEFKKKYFEDLIVSIIVKRLDLKDLLIKDGYEARKVIQFLDKSLDRKAFKGELFDVLRGMLKDVEITKTILKFFV